MSSPIPGQRYQIIIHTGDPWGRGYTSNVDFYIIGANGQLLSRDCQAVPVHAITDKREKAVQFALSLPQREPSPQGTQPSKDNVPTDTKLAETGGARQYSSSPGPAMEKRNVFGLFRMWLKRQGGQATLQALIQQTETEASTSGKDQSISGGGGSPDGTLDLYELQQLLRKAIPDCSSLEAQMFMAMVDVNGDEKLNLQELDASLSDCREIDSIVSGAGEPEKRKQLEAELASKVQTLRTKSGQLTEALQSAANKRGGYVTFQDLSATFQDIFTDITPESKRMLITHVARTANVSAADLGLPVTEVQKVLGLKDGGGKDGASASFAAGWVPGRGRDIFKLLRFHVKKNRAQVETLLPVGQDLDIQQVRAAVRAMLETRSGEPPLTGRELRLLVSMLDSNNSGTLSRDEFEGGLKDCRDICESMATFNTDASSVTLTAQVFAAEGSPLWSVFMDGMKALHGDMVARSDYVEGVVRALDSRGKGKLDMVEIRKLLIKMRPDMVKDAAGEAMLRCLLGHLDAWDPSTHGLLATKHILMAFRLQPPPPTLYPQPAGVSATSEQPEDAVKGSATSVSPKGKVMLPALGTKAQRLNTRMSEVLPGSSLLPSVEQWTQWHSNVITSDRKTANVRLGLGTRVPLSADFDQNNWKCTLAWLHEDAKRSKTWQNPASEPSGTTQPPATVLSVSTLQPGSGALASTADSAGDVAASAAQSTLSAPQATSLSPEAPNSLEERLWPDLQDPYVSFVGSVFQRPHIELKGAVLDPSKPLPPLSTDDVSGTRPLRPRPPPLPYYIQEQLRRKQEADFSVAHAAAAAPDTAFLVDRVQAVPDVPPVPPGPTPAEVLQSMMTPPAVMQTPETLPRAPPPKEDKKGLYSSFLSMFDHTPPAGKENEFTATHAAPPEASVPQPQLQDSIPVTAKGDADTDAIRTPQETSQPAAIASSPHPIPLTAHKQTEIFPATTAAASNMPTSAAPAPASDIVQPQQVPQEKTSSPSPLIASADKVEGTAAPPIPEKKGFFSSLFKRKQAPAAPQSPPSTSPNVPEPPASSLSAPSAAPAAAAVAPPAPLVPAPPPAPPAPLVPAPPPAPPVPLVPAPPPAPPVPLVPAPPPAPPAPPAPAPPPAPLVPAPPPGPAPPASAPLLPSNARGRDHVPEGRQGSAGPVAEAEEPNNNKEQMSHGPETSIPPKTSVAVAAAASAPSPGAPAAALHVDPIEALASEVLGPAAGQEHVPPVPAGAPASSTSGDSKASVLPELSVPPTGEVSAAKPGLLPVTTSSQVPAPETTANLASSQMLSPPAVPAHMLSQQQLGSLPVGNSKTESQLPLPSLPPTLGAKPPFDTTMPSTTVVGGAKPDMSSYNLLPTSSSQPSSTVSPPTVPFVSTGGSSTNIPTALESEKPPRSEINASQAHGPGTAPTSTANYPHFPGHPQGRPPLLVPTLATCFDAPLMAGQELGEVLLIRVMLRSTQQAPFYLEKVQVVQISATAPICWEAHYRGWVGMPKQAVIGAVRGEQGAAGMMAEVSVPQQGIVAGSATAAARGGDIMAVQDPAAVNGAGAILPQHLRTNFLNSGAVMASNPSSLSYGQPDLQDSPLQITVPYVELVPDPLAWEEWDLQVTSGGKTVTVYFNANLREWLWKPPYLTPLPQRPGAVPCFTPRNILAPASPQEWLHGVPGGAARSTLQYLEELDEFQAWTRVRRNYGVGKGGLLGLKDMKVRINGQLCPHAIALHGRGGFRMARPQQLQELWEQYQAATAAGNNWEPQGLPGVMEAVSLGYDLKSSATMKGSQYSWFSSTVALDDSCGLIVAPVRFSVLLDDTLMWRSSWMDGSGQMEQCYCKVAGVTSIRLVVETEFSGGARAVWVDPLLLMSPLPQGFISHGGTFPEGGIQQVMQLPAGKQQVVQQSQGDISFLLSASASTEVHAGVTANTSTFCISLFTADVRNGGTTGQVYVRLRGLRGTSSVFSKWQLLNPRVGLDRGKKMSFLVELQYMDAVTEVQLQHKAAQLTLTPDWCLQHVEVCNEVSGHTYYFLSGGWFSQLIQQQVSAGVKVAGGEDARMTLALPAVTSNVFHKVTLHVLSAGPGKPMGLDSPLSMWYTGQLPDGSFIQHPWQVPAGSITSAHTTLIMQGPVSASGLGTLVQAQLSCSLQSALASRLQCVEVVRMMDGKSFLFMGADAQVLPSQTSAVVVAACQKPMIKVSTFTGDLPEASTDARVYLNLYGEAGQLKDLYLKDTGDIFNQGQEDTFFFPIPLGLGSINSLEISHDDSGDSPNWYLERIEVTEMASGRTTTFPCNAWIGKYNGIDAELHRVLHPLTAITQSSAPSQGQDSTAVGLSDTQLMITGTIPQNSSISSFPTPVASNPSLIPSSTPDLALYHLIVHSSTKNAAEITQMWHAAESIQLAGVTQDSVIHTDTVILDSTRCKCNLQVDQAYIQYLQRQCAEAFINQDQSGQGLGGGAHPIAHAPQQQLQQQLQQQQQRMVQTYQIQVFKAALHQAPDWSASATPREVSIVMHGNISSSTALHLGAASCSSASLGVRPFTDVKQPDTFQVEAPTLGTLLRIDLQLMTSGLSGSWGMQIERVVVRDLTSSTMVEFIPPTYEPGNQMVPGVGQAAGGQRAAAAAAAAPSGASSQWLGASPSTSVLVGGTAVVGVQSMRMMPAGVSTVTFTARQVGMVKSIHLRQDCPNVYPGWSLDSIDLFVSDSLGGMANRSGPKSPPKVRPYLPDFSAVTSPSLNPKPSLGPPLTLSSSSAAPPVTLTGMYATNAASGMPAVSDSAVDTTGTTFSARNRALPQAGSDALSPHVYHFKMDEGQYAWPSSAVQYIRNYITTEAAAFAESPATYFITPSITTSSYGQPPVPGDPLSPISTLRSTLLSTNPMAAAMSSIMPTSGAAEKLSVNPVRAEELSEQYAVERSAYLAGSSNIFALLLLRLLSSPALTQKAFDACDTDRDGRVTNEQIGQVASLVLDESSPAPGGVPPLSSQLLEYLVVMVDLKRSRPLSQVELVAEIRECKEAYKKAASMHRLVSSGEGRPEFDPDLGGAEHALSILAARLVHPTGSQGLAQAFAEMDTDKSGYLDSSELITALRSIAPDLMEAELRVLISYLEHFADTDGDGKVSASELCTSLAPFVPGAPEEEIKREAQEYYKDSNKFFPLVDTAIEMQPSLLHALFIQHGLDYRKQSATAGLPSAPAAPEAGSSEQAALSRTEEVVPPSTHAPAPQGHSASDEGQLASAGGHDGSVGTTDPVIRGESIPNIVLGLLPGVTIKPEDMQYLLNMVLLDVKDGHPISSDEFRIAIKSVLEANKRAAAMYRVVQSCIQDREPVILDPDLGGHELVMHKLAQIYSGPDNAKAQQAFNAADTDGSGFLDFRELCAVLKAAQPDMQPAEMRLLIAYISDFADTQNDFKTSFEELSSVLQPFVSQE